MLKTTGFFFTTPLIVETVVVDPELVHAPVLGPEKQLHTISEFFYT